jgi:hypothetical protein
MRHRTAWILRGAMEAVGAELPAAARDGHEPRLPRTSSVPPPSMTRRVACPPASPWRSLPTSTYALRDTISELVRMDEPRRRLAAMMSGLDIHYDLGEGHYDPRR